MHLFIFKYRITHLVAGMHRYLVYNRMTTVWLSPDLPFPAAFWPFSIVFSCLLPAFSCIFHCLTCIFLLNQARGVAASLMYYCPYRARFQVQFLIAYFSILTVKWKASVILVLPFPASFLHFLAFSIAWQSYDDWMTTEWPAFSFWIQQGALPPRWCMIALAGRAFWLNLK